jgi:hypothetical protein
MARLFRNGELLSEGSIYWDEASDSWVDETHNCRIANCKTLEFVFVKDTIISMRQARLQLLSMNLLDAVNSQISTMSQSAQIEWEYATEVQRSNPLVSALQVALLMTDSDMDLFFSDAVKL